MEQAVLDLTAAGIRLTGVLSTRDVDRARVARDFGGFVRHLPRAVLMPGSAQDVAAVVGHCHRAGLTVVARGAGHSVDGQTQTRDGLVVDMGTLSTVRRVGADRVSVDTGARWSTVVVATLARGLVPPVLPDYLELTVGGTLSVGGIGGTSHRYGCQADNVLDLDVVTPDGDLVTCSPGRDRDLFDAVRGGQGRHGIVTRATLALVAAPRQVRRHQLTYTDLATFLADANRLAEQGRFDHLVGLARPGAGRDWVFGLDVAYDVDPGELPDDRAFLGDLAYDCEHEPARTLPYGGFLGRYASIETHLRAVGSWQHDLHPRCTVLLPGRHAVSVIGAVLGGLTPADLGVGGSVLVYPIPTARLVAPNVPKAQDDPVTVVFGLQRTAAQGDAATLARMRRDNAALRAAAVRVGGGGYAYGGDDDPVALRC
ncbi:FAD-binding protein [Micromonospora sp. NPDC000207]|uniref:FAD-binding protein n=1 Tax=Micromonospora sp. NPDC000207 TaxID=3154246 RepID=UPI00332F5492